MNWLLAKLSILGHKVLTSRKAMFALLLLVFSCIALWFGKLDASNWRLLIMWLFGTYVASQGAVDACEKLKGQP